MHDHFETSNPHEAKAQIPEPLLNDAQAAQFLGGLHPRQSREWLGAGRFRRTVLRSIGAIVPVNSQSGSCYIHRARYTRLLIEGDSMSRRYQEGCLYRESRKAGPDVWVFRYRDGQANRKEIVGTVEQFTTQKAAMKSCESLRANINKEDNSPRTMAEMVTHYTANELPNKAPYTAEVYAGYLRT